MPMNEKNYANSLDCCNIVYATRTLLKFYLLNSWRSIYGLTLLLN